MAEDHWWEPPAGVAGLTPPQRVAFCLVCVEHLLPSVTLQVQAHPRSLPPGLAAASLQGCLDALWAWLAAPDGPPPGCVTEEQAREAYDGALVGLTYLVVNVYTVAWSAIEAYARPEHAAGAGSETLSTIDALVGEILGPSFGGLSARAATGRPELLAIDAELNRRQAEAPQAVARHELVGVETRAQTEAYGALAAGVDPVDLRTPARAAGQQVAAWTARLLAFQDGPDSKPLAARATQRATRSRWFDIALSWWRPPLRFTTLPAPRRLTFGLACVEHLLPSLELQAAAHPGSLPEGLSVAAFRDCLDALWAWQPAGPEPPPRCLTEDDAYAAGRGVPAGLAFLAGDAYAILWFARSSYDDPLDLAAAARVAHAAAVTLVDELIDARGGGAERARREAEPPDALARHELPAIAARAQDETYEALAAGADPRDLRAPARAVGRQLATWTARLLEGSA